MYFFHYYIMGNIACLPRDATTLDLKAGIQVGNHKTKQHKPTTNEKAKIKKKPTKQNNYHWFQDTGVRLLPHSWGGITLLRAKELPWALVLFLSVTWVSVEMNSSFMGSHTKRCTCHTEDHKDNLFLSANKRLP